MTIDTPQAAAEERSKLSRALRDAVEEQKTAGLERAELQHAYDEVYNPALLKSKLGSAEKRKAEAAQEASGLSLKLLRAEVIESYWKTRTRAIETDMELLKTIAAGIRREYEDAMRGPSHA